MEDKEKEIIEDKEKKTSNQVKQDSDFDDCKNGYKKTIIIIGLIILIIGGVIFAFQKNNILGKTKEDSSSNQAEAQENKKQEEVKPDNQEITKQEEKEENTETPPEEDNKEDKKEDKKPSKPSTEPKPVKPSTNNQTNTSESNKTPESEPSTQPEVPEEPKIENISVSCFQITSEDGIEIKEEIDAIFDGQDKLLNEITMKYEINLKSSGLTDDQITQDVVNELIGMLELEECFHVTSSFKDSVIYITAKSERKALKDYFPEDYTTEGFFYYDNFIADLKSNNYTVYVDGHKI